MSGQREERLAALFDAHEDRLYGLARRLAGSADEANDLVQETFLRAAASIGTVPADPANAEAWLVRVLINIRRDQWRKEGVRRRAAALLRAGERATAADPESSLMTSRAVWGALDALSPRRRAIVVMHELEGMDLPAIAAILGVRRMTVQWHLSMARRDLKRLLTAAMGETT